MKNTAVIILAAGDGSRMQSSIPKYLHKIGGKTLIDYLIDTVESLNFSRKIIVTNTKYNFKRDGWERVLQNTPNGTGAAVMAAKDVLSDFSGDVLILYSDSPFITTKTIANLILAKQEKDNSIFSIAFNSENPFGYGRIISKDENEITRIVEEKDLSENEKNITLCNAGHLICDKQLLFNTLDKICSDEQNKEKRLTDIFEKIDCKSFFITCEEDEVLGINTRQELAKAEDIFQNKKRQEVMANGVTLQSPETTFFSHDTIIGKDCIIEPCVIFEPGSYIPPKSKVMAFSRVNSKTKKANTRIEKIFSLRLLILITTILCLILSPFFIWAQADEEKRGLCLQSLEMCVINSKYDENAIGILGCSYSNLKCLVTGKILDFEDISETETQNNEVKSEK